MPKKPSTETRTATDYGPSSRKCDICGEREQVDNPHQHETLLDPPPTLPNVWEENGEWFHRDETESVYGPFATEALATASFDDYVDELEGRPPKIPPRLLALVTEMWALQDEVANDEEALKNKKARLRLLEEHEVAELVTERELPRGVRTPDGRTLTFERSYHVSVAKPNQAAVFAALANLGVADAMMKRAVVLRFPKDAVRVVRELQTAIARMLPTYQVSVRAGKAPEGLINAIKTMLAAAEIDVTIEEEQELPGSTLRSWVIKRHALGQPIPEGIDFHCPMKVVTVSAPVTEGTTTAAS